MHTCIVITHPVDYFTTTVSPLIYKGLKTKNYVTVFAPSIKLYVAKVLLNL